MPPDDVLLLCATEVEARLVMGALHAESDETHAGTRTLGGHVAGASCRLVIGGIGPVNAAHALTREVERRRPALALQFGIAGAFVPAGVPVGSALLASEEIYGDLGVLTPEGWQPADVMGFPLVAGEPPRFNRLPLDAALVGRAARVAGQGGPLRSGPFLTLSQVTGVRAVGDDLYRRFGALCESMEGAAAAHVCALYGLPFLEVRGVSNLVEDRHRAAWRVAEAAAAAQAVVLRLVSGLRELLDAG